MPESQALVVQMTVDGTQALTKLDQISQVLHVGFYAYIKRLGVRHCGVCGKRRICYAIEVTGITSGLGSPAGEATQLVGIPKCAEHSGIR